MADWKEVSEGLHCDGHVWQALTAQIRSASPSLGQALQAWQSSGTCWPQPLHRGLSTSSCMMHMALGLEPLALQQACCIPSRPRARCSPASHAADGRLHCSHCKMHLHARYMHVHSSACHVIHAHAYCCVQVLWKGWEAMECALHLVAQAQAACPEPVFAWRHPFVRLATTPKQAGS